MGLVSQIINVMEQILDNVKPPVLDDVTITNIMACSENTPKCSPLRYSIKLHGNILLQTGAQRRGGYIGIYTPKSVYLKFSRALFLFYQKASGTLKYAQNALAAGAPPRTPLGELMTLPQTLQSAGEGDTPSTRTPPSRRLRRLVYSVYPPRFLGIHHCIMIYTHPNQIPGYAPGYKDLFEEVC